MTRWSSWRRRALGRAGQQVERGRRADGGSIARAAITQSQAAWPGLSIRFLRVLCRQSYDERHRGQAPAAYASHIAAATGSLHFRQQDFQTEGDSS